MTWATAAPTSLLLTGDRALATTGGPYKSEQRIDAFGDQFFGIPRCPGRIVAVVERLDFNLVAAGPVLGVDGIKKDFGAVEVGQPYLFDRTREWHRLAKNHFLAGS